VKRSTPTANDLPVPLGPALAAVLRATTLEAMRAAGAHDAVVVGSGAAGGLAALLLAEAGLRVLVLDAGSPQSLRRSPLRQLTMDMVKRLSGPEALRFLPPALVPLGTVALRRGLGWWRQPVQSRCYAWSRAPEAFVDDLDCPYVTPPNRPFVWLRARLLGGRMVVPGHGRQYYRLGSDDLAPADGLSPPWPLKPGELDPWYRFVERRLDLAGCHDRVPWLPDSELSHLLEPTADEAALRHAIVARWPSARPVLGRFAPPLDALEAAAKTGRLLCRQGAIVREINVDDSGRVRGVVWFDQQNDTEERVCAPLVFLCASALESTRILLLSRSSRGREGLGAASGVLGRFLMDHVNVSGWGSGPPLLDPVLREGRSLYLPRFDARRLSTPDPGRGFGVQLYQFPASSGRSHFRAVSFSEMLPRPENRVTLDPYRRDAWGIPVLRIDCAHSDAELVRARDQLAAIQELAEVADAKLLRVNKAPGPPGSAIHECGTARMGWDPATSVLDPHNQCWEARGLYVTDGACFPSQGIQNPTLTILALTARACDHALRAVR
jgi:choline dehydrogenase-like flavoprotein